MTPTTTNQPTQGPGIEPWSANLLRWTGYGLLAMAVLDLIEIFIPAMFLNPAWELQTMGTLVERVPVPLLALVLIFYGKNSLRRPWETFVLKGLSMVSGIFGVFLVLTIVLGIFNTLRVKELNTTQIRSQLDLQLSQAQQLELQLTNATPLEMENYLKRQGRSLEGKTPQEVKSQLFVELAKARKVLESQAKSTQTSRYLALFKSAIKWNLEALVAGALFIYIWKATRWVRTM